jgi:hypothetical protein
LAVIITGERHCAVVNFERKSTGATLLRFPNKISPRLA